MERGEACVELTLTWHFLAQFCFLHVHVITDAAAQGRARRCANQRAFAAVFLGGGERPNACADQRADTRANAGFTRFTLTGIRVSCAARNSQCTAHQSGNNEYAFFHLLSLILFILCHGERGS